MSIIRPQCNPDDIPHDSERVVYTALRDQLSQEYVVLHSYPWLRPDRDGSLREGETDFVVLHREKGVLVLEVKGGELDYRNASWFRRNAIGWKSIIDPFVQARKNMHALLADIETRSAADVRKSDVAYGYAVVFPHHDYRGELPPGTAASILIRQPDVAKISESIERAFGAWPARESALDDRRWNKLLNAVLPTFKLFRPLAGEMGDVLRNLHQLTTEQTHAFQGLYEDNPRVFVRGVAGSGKTLLALDRAIKFAESGLRTLLVCFNRQLAEALIERVEKSEVHSGCLDRLEIRHFHGLAHDLITRAQLPFTVPDEIVRVKRFWEEDVPDLMEQAVMVLMEEGEVQFGAIVMDEGQDFHRRWWECLQFSLLEDSERGPIYAFSDPDQSLWDWSVEEPPITFGATYRLTRNCRNTRSVARASAEVGHVVTQVFERSPKGRRVVSKHANPAAGKGIVLAEVRRLLEEDHVPPSDLVLIGAFGWKKGSLAEVSEINGIPLTDSAATWRHSRSILITTSRSFKGLEAPVVLIYDVNAFSPTFTRTDLYVAITRAQSHCVLVIGGRELGEEIKQAIAASEGDGT